jgi:hypothetical protein
MKRSTLGAFATLCLLISPLLSQAQFVNKLGMSVDGGVGLLFGDITTKQEPGNRTNLAFSAGVSYYMGDAWRFTAQWTQGNFAGGNGATFFESSYIEPSAIAAYDLMTFIDKKSSWLLELEAGLGWTAFYSTAYDQGASSVLARVPSEGTYSNTASGIFGGKLGYRIHDKIDLRLGYSQRLMWGNDWFDGANSGEGNDQYGVITVGVAFRLKSDVKKGEMKVKEREYETLVSENRQLKDEVELAMVEHEANLKAKDETIAQLQSRIDSMESMPAVNTAKEAAALEREEALDGGIMENKYHVVIGSFKSQNNAETYVNEQFATEKDKIKIIYVQDMKMYRVIYNSYDSFYDAKRDIEKLKDRVKGLWIVRY